MDVESSNSNNFCNGPDQIIPSNSFKTSEPDGAVTIFQTDLGPSSGKPISVYSMFKKAYIKYPNSPAMLVKRDRVWRTWTYKDYFEESCMLAKALIKLGLEQFHGVCIMGNNTPEWCISVYGTIFAGGLNTGVYTTNSPEACRVVADNCRAQVIIVEDLDCLNKYLAVKRFLPEIKVIIQWSGIPGAPGVISWAEALAIGRNESDEELNKRLSLAAINQCCTLIYTSGTTGPPKGVMLSQDQITWIASFYQDFFGLKDTELAVVSFLPFSHLAAQMGDMHCSIKSAGVIYFAQPDALKGSLGETLQEVQPTAFFSVPRLWEKIYDKMQEKAAESGYLTRSIGAWAKEQGLNYYKAIIEGRPLSSMESAKYKAAKYLIFDKVREAIGLKNARYLVSGSAPIALEVLEYFMSLDMPILEGYGLSESLSLCSFSQAKEGGIKLGSVGKVLPQTEVFILPNKEYRQGEGEICIRGRNICMGYLRMPDETDATIDDEGWLHTGDLGWLDSEGFLFITGRLKELVITAGGENIPPVIIEDAVKKELPCVSNAVLVGDKRKYLTILLTLKSEVDLDTMMPLEELTAPCITWMRAIGSQASTVDEAIHEIKQNNKSNLFKAIQEGIDRYNTHHSISNAQRVQKWTILPHDFSLPTEELNNTLKIKRSFVVKKYEDVIEEMYSESPSILSKL